MAGAGVPLFPLKFFVTNFKAEMHGKSGLIKLHVGETNFEFSATGNR